MSNENTTNENTVANPNAIDRAIAAVNARRAAGGSPAITGRPVGTAVAAPKRPKLTDEEKAARDAQRKTEREAKAAERAAAREAKKAQKDASKKPAHMSKVLKAAERLPSMSEDAQGHFDTLAASLSLPDIEALCAHLGHFTRLEATKAALSTKLEAGQQVVIVSGDPRYVGLMAKVTKAQRIRCYVELNDAPGREVYLFTSNVQALSDEQIEALEDAQESNDDAVVETIESTDGEQATGT